MKVKKPIFVIGSGRSGTTIFYKTLAQHHELAYFTNYEGRFPKLFKIGLIPKLEKNKLISRLMEKIRPIEPDQEIMGIHNYCGIVAKGLPLDENDVGEEDKSCFRKMITKCLKYRDKNRFISKNTNNGLRIRYLNEIFPDALFIHVLRDGRANVNSYLNVDFFYDIKFWWLDNRDYNDWEEEGKDITRLAALHWRHNIEEITKQAKILPKNRYLIIRYEEFTEDPMINFKKIIEFCGLDWNEQFRDVLKNTNFENRNFKWKENLTPSQKAILDDVLSDTLIQLGYK